MAELTISQWVRKQRKLQSQMRVGKPLEIAARTVHTLRVRRIFHEGKGSGGGSIGSYNKTKEIWVKNSELRRANRGKSGRATEVSYFKSYYDLKRSQGFNPDIVNLRLTNDLQSDFANARLSKTDDSPPQGTPIKVSPTLWKEELRRNENVVKLTAAESKFGPITAPTQKEREDFERVGRFEMLKMLREAGW